MICATPMIELQTPKTDTNLTIFETYFYADKKEAMNKIYHKFFANLFVEYRTDRLTKEHEERLGSLFRFT